MNLPPEEIRLGAAVASCEEILKLAQEEVAAATADLEDARAALAAYRAANGADDVPGLDNPTGQPEPQAPAAPARHLTIAQRRQAEQREREQGRA